MRREVEAIKIDEHVSDDEIDKWNGAIENVMESGEEPIETLQFRLEEIQLEQKSEREKQEQEKRIEFELKLHEAKIKMQAEAEVPTKSTSAKRRAMSQIIPVDHPKQKR